MNHRLAGGLALAVLVALMPAQSAQAEPEASPSPTAPVVGDQKARTTTVTLVTGDRLSVVGDPSGRMSVVPLPRPDGTEPEYSIWQEGRDQYVVPVEAMPALAAGTLDPELFNVTGLIRQGFDDAHTDTLPLIAVYDEAAVSTLAAPAAPPATRRTAVLDSVDGVALTTSKQHAEQFWASVAPALTGQPTTLAAGGPRKLWLDSKVEVSLDRSTHQVGADEAWASGYDGTGTTIAILDTGIDAEHPDLAGQVALTKDFTGKGSVEDGHGHGTHVASIAAGTGAASDGAKRGVAPGAQLVVGKVLSDFGWGLNSWIIAGMEWAVAQHPDVINMSLGGTAPECTGPLATAAKELTANTDTLFVAAAGNNGDVPGAWIDAPGCAPGALTVGAVDREDAAAWFTSRGFVTGTHTVKPEIAAPGDGISAALAGGRGDNAYTTISGTSMAAPHVAGAAAILRQRHPDWTAQRVKAALVSASENEVDGTVRELGAGRLDIPAALSGTVLGPPAVQAGAFAWPQDNAEATTTDVTYTNLGDQAVTLDLDITDVTGNDGEAAPDGIAALGAGEVTVPAGGTASVPLTVDPTVDLGTGLYGDLGGRIVATSPDGATITTPFGFHMEPESVTLTVRVVDHDGGPAGFGTSIDLASIDTGHAERRYLMPGGSPETYRLRAGTYHISSLVRTVDPGAAPGLGLVDSYTYLAHPEIELTEDTTIVFDARDAHRVSVDSYRRLMSQGATIYYGRWWDERVIAGGFVGREEVNALYGWVDEEATDGGFEFGTYWRMTAPELTMRVLGHDGFEIDTTYFIYRQKDDVDHTRFEGRGRAELVNAGTGTPEELAAAGARGNVALVRAENTWDSRQLSRNALAAGAVGLLIYVDRPGRWYPNYENTLPHAAIEQTTAHRLLDRLAEGPVRLAWHGIPESPFVYNLAYPETEPITDDLNYRIRWWRLARVHEEWYATGPSASYVDWMSQMRPWNPTRGIPIASYQRVPSPGDRIAYYSPVGAWMHASKTNLHYGITMNDHSSYRPGERRHEEWYRGVLTPAASSPFDGTPTEVGQRRGNLMGVKLDFGEWSDSDPSHWSAGGTQDWSVLELRKNGELIGRIEDDRGVFGGLSGEEATYELTWSIRTSDRARETLQRSTSVDTTFRFRSDSPGQSVNEPLPMVFPHYTAPVDHHNRVDAHGLTWLPISATGTAGYEPGRITDAKVWYSYDGGEHWTRAFTFRLFGTWVALATHWRHSGDTVALKVELTDSNGAGVTQTVQAAYTVA